MYGLSDDLGDYSQEVRKLKETLRKIQAFVRENKSLTPSEKDLLDLLIQKTLED